VEHYYIVKMREAGVYLKSSAKAVGQTL